MGSLSNRSAFLLGATLLSIAPVAAAKEIHLDCERESQIARVDIDTDRAFMQIIWSEGVAEEFKDGDSYILGPDKDGRKEKVAYVMHVERDVVTFGTDRSCLDEGARKCVDQHARNTLDVNRGEMKYDDGDTIAVLKCHPAPPGRRF